MLTEFLAASVLLCVRPTPLRLVGTPPPAEEQRLCFWEPTIVSIEWLRTRIARWDRQKDIKGTVYPCEYDGWSFWLYTLIDSSIPPCPPFSILSSSALSGWPSIVCVRLCNSLWRLSSSSVRVLSYGTNTNHNTCSIEINSLHLRSQRPLLRTLLFKSTFYF